MADRPALSGLPQFDRRIWLLAAGRLLSQVGIGFTLFYAPIFFVDRVGLTATQVGLGLGLGSLAGMGGRFLGGSLADAPTWGRRPTLLASALVSAVADGVLVASQGFPLFLLGNLLMGFGVGLYWPATEAVVADLSTPQQRNEAYAVVRLADNLGLSAGVVLGGLLIQLTNTYRALFAIDGLTFLLFFWLIYRAIPETRQATAAGHRLFTGWGQALGDRALLVYVPINVVFTAFLAQVHSTLPVYLSQFAGPSGGLSTGVLSLLFTGHVVLTALCQLPLARRLGRLSPPRALMVAAGLWAVGFGSVALVGVGEHAIAGAALALGIMAVATAAYTPVASALVVALAPETLRGVYLSVNSMCWAVGYFVGPAVGGWALDQGAALGLWLGLAATGLPLGSALRYLHTLLRQRLNHTA